MPVAAPIWWNFPQLLVPHTSPFKQPFLSSESQSAISLGTKFTNSRTRIWIDGRQSKIQIGSGAKTLRNKVGVNSNANGRTTIAQAAHVAVAIFRVKLEAFLRACAIMSSSAVRVFGTFRSFRTKYIVQLVFLRGKHETQLRPRESPTVTQITHHQLCIANTRNTPGIRIFQPTGSVWKMFLLHTMHDTGQSTVTLAVVDLHSQVQKVTSKDFT